MNILIIAPAFYGYHIEIQKSLSRFYEKVFLFPELPTKTISHYYFIEKISSKIACFLWDKYEDKIVNTINNNSIDTVFIIRGYKLRESLFNKILSSNPNINFINYQWDSLRNNPNSVMISRYSKKNFSFDRIDTINNPLYKYIPLFYINDKINYDNSIYTKTESYDFLVVASWNRYREDLLSKFEKENPEYSYFIHLYVPKEAIIKRRISIKELFKKGRHLYKLPAKVYFSKLLKTRVVIDIPSPTQNGLSIRTIEALRLNKKIITTNGAIKDEKIFDPNNILIWKDKEVPPIADFLNQPFNKTVFGELLSVDKWLELILMD